MNENLRALLSEYEPERICDYMYDIFKICESTDAANAKIEKIKDLFDKELGVR